MMSVLSGRMGRYLSDAGRAVERAPVEVAIAVAVAVAFSYNVAWDGDAFRAWFEFATAAALTLAAAWTGTLLHALGVIDRTQRWAITLAGAVVAAGYAMLFADFERASEGWRAAMLVSAAVLWLTAVPVLAARRRTTAERAVDGAAPVGGAPVASTPDVAAAGVDSGTAFEPHVPMATDRMRTVTGRILLRVLGALLYCGALYLGLALALAAVNTLFELDFDGKIYGHVFGWIFLALAPWIVVGGLDDYARPATPRSEVAGVVKRMAAFLVPPLLALYYVILYAYTVRIAVTGEVPKNLVSPLVFAAGVLAALGLLLFDPRSREATAFRTLRMAPPLFLPLAALGMWAVSLRVSQYGWTEFRLLRLLLLAGMAALALGATVQLVRRQRLALHFVPLGLAALLLLGAIGPWSVQATARRSQQARLERALHAAGIDPSRPAPVAPATPAPPMRAARPAAGAVAVFSAVARDEGGREVPATVYDDIEGAARYLFEHFGTSALPPALAAAVRSREDSWNIGGRLGLVRTGQPDGPQPPIAAHLPPGQAVQVGGLSVTRVQARSPERQAGTPAPQAVQDSSRLVISAGGERLTVDLDALARALRDAHADGRPDRRVGALASESVIVDVFDTAGRRRGSLLVLEIFMTFEEGRYRLENLDALLVL